MPSACDDFKTIRCVYVLVLQSFINQEAPFGADWVCWPARSGRRRCYPCDPASSVWGTGAVATSGLMV